jgi:hypothetical protein
MFREMLSNQSDSNGDFWGVRKGQTRLWVNPRSQPHFREGSNACAIRLGIEDAQAPRIGTEKSLD